MQAANRGSCAASLVLGFFSALGTTGHGFAMAEEGRLHQAILDVGSKADPLLVDEDFSGAMGALAHLRQPVDDFFDKVTVNAEEADLRANRLCLLSQIRVGMDAIADFSKIEG